MAGPLAVPVRRSFQDVIGVLLVHHVERVRHFVLARLNGALDERPQVRRFRRRFWSCLLPLCRAVKFCSCLTRHLDLATIGNAVFLCSRSCEPSFQQIQSSQLLDKLPTATLPLRRSTLVSV
jgi:hypothetical protein